jgi:hypothetical protein
MAEREYPSLGERLSDLIRRRPGLTTEQLIDELTALGERLADDTADAVEPLAWALSDDFREIDGGWYLRDQPLPNQSPGAGRERDAVAALECFLSEGPRRTEEVRQWYGRVVVDPPARSLDELLEEHCVKGRSGWRLPTAKERGRAVSARPRAETAKPTRREAVFGFRKLALAVLQRCERPLTAEEILRAVFQPSTDGAGWLRERESALPACATPEEFQALCALPEGSTAVDCARLLLGRTSGIRRYDRDTFGLDDWADNLHLLYYWAELESCVLTAHERDFDRCAAEIANLDLDEHVAQRVRATLPVYRRHLAAGTGPRRLP